MKIRSTKSTRRQAATGRRAFTLIELLAVILILSILLTLGGAAALYLIRKADRDKTIATMQIIHRAIDAYDEFNEPHKLSDAFSDDPSKDNTHELLDLLWNSTDSRKILQTLPKGAIKEGAEGKSFFDSYGEEMQYDRDGGLAGTPRLISNGPDEDFDTDDDILSDEHKK